MTETRFNFPSVCCRCLGQATSTMIATASHEHVRFIVPVPICGRCQATISRRERILAGLLLVVGAAAGVMAVRSQVPHDVAVGALFTTIHWVGGLFLGGLAGLLVFALAVSPFLDPVKIRSNGWIVFRNRWYREEFKRLNSAEFKRLHGC